MTSENENSQHGRSSDDKSQKLLLASSVRLEWDALVAALAKQAITPMGRAELGQLRPDLERDEVEHSLGLIEELRNLIHEGCAPRMSGLADIRELLRRAKRDADLDSLELLQVGHSLEILAELRAAFRNCEVPSARARELVQDMGDYAPLAKSIQWSIDPSGAILDEASDNLRRLRRMSKALREEIKTRLDAILGKLSSSGILQENYYTERNDRYVLPVRSDRRGGFKGIVHDASNSGQTLFIEPQELVEPGNKWRIAEASVQEEEQRIIAALIARIAERSVHMLADMQGAATLDAFLARARLADLLEAEVPSISAKPSLDLQGARHPGLLLAFFNQGGRDAMRAVVANDIIIQEPSRALVISGPNAGGKTIALKTAGLCALMLRAGLPIPAMASSKLSLFTDVLAVLGDEQSVDAHLSTFSAHIMALEQMLQRSQNQQQQGATTLCMIDEIARGTDPEQGACLGQAFLEKLVDANAMVIVTTHYDRLKALALDDDRFRNAAVQLDPQGQRPSFRLHLNQPGGSSAFAIARNLGINDRVLQRARELSSPDTQRVDSYLDELAKERSQVAHTRHELERARKKMNDNEAKLKEERASLKQQRLELRAQSRAELLGDVHKARREVAEIIADLQRGGISAKRADKAAHALKAIEGRVEARLKHSSDGERDQQAQNFSFSVGQKVWHKGLNREATILEIKGKHIELQCGALRTRVKIQQIRPLRDDDKQAPKVSKKLKKYKDFNALKNNFSVSAASPSRPPRSSYNTLDLRGQRVEEALENCERFFDQRLRDNTMTVFLLHGHGTGALREALRRELPGSDYVSSLRPADEDDGGEAFTMVELA